MIPNAESWNVGFILIIDLLPKTDIGLYIYIYTGMIQHSIIFYDIFWHFVLYRENTMYELYSFKRERIWPHCTNNRCVCEWVGVCVCRFALQGLLRAQITQLFDSWIPLPLNKARFYCQVCTLLPLRLYCVIFWQMLQAQSFESLNSFPSPDHTSSTSLLLTFIMYTLGDTYMFPWHEFALLMVGSIFIKLKSIHFVMFICGEIPDILMTSYFLSVSYCSLLASFRNVSHYIMTYFQRYLCDSVGVL